MQINPVIVEMSVEAPHKIENRSAYDPCVPHHGQDITGKGGCWYLLQNYS